MRGRVAFARLFSWTGALLFLISLAYFLFEYLTRFDAAPAGADVGQAVTWNVTIFTGFALHHSIFARARLRAWIARALPEDVERSLYVWIASLLFIAVCASWRPVPGIAWEANGVSLWILRVVQAAGLVLILRSAVVLDIRDLTGLRAQAPGLRLRPEARGLGPTEFKMAGPYGWVRHPIYTGWFILVFAASPMTMTRLLFAVVSAAYLLAAIPLEERTIRAASNGAYDRYMRAVRWRLLPGVY